jgi:3-hydroxyacyl-[acyl-carrier-protein] dehydratase
VRDVIERACLDRADRDAEGNPVFSFRFAPDEPIFRGHFPGRPILPGAFQTEMAREAAEWAAGRRLSIREVVKAKFTRPLLPGETIRLALRLEERDGFLSASARLSAGGEPAGEVRLILTDVA